MTEHLLSSMLFLPLAGMLVLLAAPGWQARTVRLWSFGVSLATLALSLVAVFRFDSSDGGFQLVEKAAWIPTLGVQYSLGVDGISLLLVLLTTGMMPLVFLASWNVTQKVTAFHALFLLIETATLGVFLSLDAFLFYLFFDLVLIPMYFVIALWGGPQRLYASMKFFLYTLCGSVLMLLGLIGLYFAHMRQFGSPSFEISELMKVQMPLAYQQWIFWALFAGFAIKIPMFPFHTWLPDAHVEAPTAGSVVLASLLLKLGTYGFLRFSLPLVPQASSDLTIVRILLTLSIIAILYGALVSLMQREWKRLIAYSSVSHMGFCTLGIFALNPIGIAGSVLQQVNHGISTGLLFLLAGMMYERRGKREIAAYGGLASSMPKFAFIFGVAVFSSAGLPLLNGFVGEFAILQGAFQVGRVWAAFGVAGLVLAAAYLLWLYQRTMLGPVTHEENRYLKDLSGREMAVLLPLVVLTFAIGLYPRPLFDVLQKPVAALVERVHQR